MQFGKILPPTPLCVVSISLHVQPGLQPVLTMYCVSGVGVYVHLLQWPGCLDAVKPPNAGLKLFGGAAFERCLNEFQVAANLLAFPTCETFVDTQAAHRHLIAVVEVGSLRLRGSYAMTATLLESTCCSPHFHFANCPFRFLQLLWRVTVWQTCCWHTR